MGSFSTCMADNQTEQGQLRSLVCEVDESKSSVLSSISVVGYVDAGDGSTGRK